MGVEPVGYAVGGRSAGEAESATTVVDGGVEVDTIGAGAVAQQGDAAGAVDGTLGKDAVHSLSAVEYG